MSLKINAPVAVSLRPHPRAVAGDRREVSETSMPTAGPWSIGTAGFTTTCASR